MNTSPRRLAARFAALRARNEKALVIYLTAFDPNRERSLQLLFDAARGGADVLEVGVPWSDPSADGPVIQRAMLRGLSAGATLARTLALCAELRHSVDTPMVLFGYYNPILAYGPERFAKDAAAAGIDGALVVDLPPEEAAELDEPLLQAGLCRVPLLAPTTNPARARLLVQSPACGGFAYYVGLTGVTGAGHLDIADVTARTAVVKATFAQREGGAEPLPLAVGFGVRDEATAAALARVSACDAVVVGSAIVQAQEEGQDIAALVSRLKRAILTA